jgi:hypothetical protein
MVVVLSRTLLVVGSAIGQFIVVIRSRFFRAVHSSSHLTWIFAYDLRVESDEDSNE